MSTTKVSQPIRDLVSLSKIDPEFSREQEQCDKDISALWSLSIEGMRAQYRDYPPAIPENTPKPGIDIEIAHQMVPVRDGSAVEIRCYKKFKSTTTNALLFLVSHGGGMSFTRRLGENRAR